MNVLNKISMLFGAPALSRKPKNGLAPRVLTMLSLSPHEQILYLMKIHNNPFYKNSQREVRVLWVLTNDRLIFMDYFRIPMRPEYVLSPRERDIEPLSEITGITAKKKKYTLSPQPILVIQTKAAIYELVFYREKSCVNSLNELKALIRELNPTTEFNDEISKKANKPSQPDTV